MAPRIKRPAEEHGINWGLKLGRVDYAEKLQATVGALIFLGFGLSKLRKEIAASKIEGLKYAREQLESNDFQRWSKHIEETLSEGGNEYPETIDGDIFKAMDRIDFVAELIDLEYVDKALLFYLFADSLFHIDTAITDFEQRENSQISAIRARFPNGCALLKEASKASSEVQSKGVERLKKYMTT